MVVRAKRSDAFIRVVEGADPYHITLKKTPSLVGTGVPDCPNEVFFVCFKKSVYKC